MPIIKLVKNSVESGVAQGQILDSFTGEAIVNANIVIKKINLDSIENVRSTITDGNGGYSISLPAGYYAAEASAAGYIPATFEIITIEKQTIPAQNGVLTPVLEEGQMCIVLTWGETPADLDSHLTGPSTQGLPFHICYYNLASRNENEVLVDLDLDDTDSFGPETTTIYTALSGKYSFYVHDFTNRDNPTSAALANSGAKVSVYLRNSLAKEYHVPSGLIGVTWNVFEFEDGTFSFSSSTAADIADIEGDDYYQGKIKIQGDTLSQVKEFTDMDLHNLGFEKGETLLDLVDRFGLPTGYTSREELIADMQTGMLRREHSSPSSSANWHEQGVYYAYFSPVDWTLRSIDLDANAYLNKLPHQITSDTNLETIVERFGLDARISDICKRTSLEDIWEYCQTHRLSAILYEGDPEFKRVEIALRNGTLVYSEYSYMDSSNQEMEFDHQWEFSFDTEQATLTLSLDEYQINNISLHFDREWD